MQMHVMLFFRDMPNFESQFSVCTAFSSKQSIHSLLEPYAPNSLSFFQYLGVILSKNITPHDYMAVLGIHGGHWIIKVSFICLCNYAARQT